MKRKETETKERKLKVAKWRKGGRRQRRLTEKRNGREVMKRKRMEKTESENVIGRKDKGKGKAGK